jgi:hypothetical protein
VSDERDESAEITKRIAEIRALARAITADRAEYWMPEGAVRLAEHILWLLGLDGPEPLLVAYETQLEQHNALLDKIEAMATDDSLDVKLIAAIVKRERPAR